MRVVVKFCRSQPLDYAVIVSAHPLIGNGFGAGVVPESDGMALRLTGFQFAHGVRRYGDGSSH